VRTNTIYLLESSSSLLSFSNNKIKILFTNEREILMQISLDWLNNIVYILMSSVTNINTIVYSINKFYLDQNKTEKIVSGFDSKPLQIEVDPCNG